MRSRGFYPLQCCKTKLVGTELYWTTFLWLQSYSAAICCTGRVTLIRGLCRGQSSQLKVFSCYKPQTEVTTTRFTSRRTKHLIRRAPSAHSWSPRTASPPARYRTRRPADSQPCGSGPAASPTTGSAPGRPTAAPAPPPAANIGTIGNIGTRGHKRGLKLLKGACHHLLRSGNGGKLPDGLHRQIVCSHVRQCKLVHLAQGDFG